VPCRYDPERPVVYDCIASIREHHPDEKIVVVDANSPTRAYLNDLYLRYDAIPWPVGNDGYAPRAIKMVVDHYPEEPFFYLFFDSLTVHDNLDDLKAHDLTTVRYFTYPRTGWGWDRDGTPLDDWARLHGCATPNSYHGVFGPMIAATRETIAAANLFRLIPRTKEQQCGLERCWGIWLEAAGYDVTHSLQGEMFSMDQEFDESRVSKRILARD
jgi:hypothetical protein